MEPRMAPLFLLSCCMAVEAGPYPGPRGTTAPSLATVPPTVGVQLRFQLKQSPGVEKLLRKEVEDIFRPTALRFRWELPNGKSQITVNGQLVMIEMRGHCHSWPLRESGQEEHQDLPLGWTLIKAGEVVPYSVVDCDGIAQMMRRQRNPPPGTAAWTSMYWLLTGRVVAHELMHALLRTTGHGRTDTTRARLRFDDLIFPARLEREEVAALRRLGQESPGVQFAGRAHTESAVPAPASSP